MGSFYKFVKQEVRSIDYIRIGQETWYLSLPFSGDSIKKPLLFLGSFVAVSFVSEVSHSQLL